MTELTDDYDFQKNIIKYIKENKLSIEQGIDLAYKFGVVSTLSLQMWDIEEALDNDRSLEEVKDLLLEELEMAENEYDDLVKACNVDL
ncbi:MAG: hypothetical protein IJD16_01620 [Desulfovibrio sp.]|nr:hypothetical protein [Desulfovibrio sp.]